MRHCWRIMMGLGAVMALASCNSLSKLLTSSNQTHIYDKGLEYYRAKKYRQAQLCFEQVAPYFTGTAKADTIAFYSASCSYNQGDFEVSSMALDQFRRQFSRSPFIEEAEYMYALGYYYLSPAPQRDQTFSLQAVQAMQSYLDRYPNSVKRDQTLEKIEELKQKMFDKAFLNAKVYYDTENYKSAVIAFRNVLDKYPDTQRREDILYLIARSHYLLAHNSYAQFQRERYAAMMDAYYTFVSEYPDSKRVEEMDKMLNEAKAYLARYGGVEEGEASGENAAGEQVVLTPAQMRAAKRMDRKVERIERKANRVAVAEDGSAISTERLDKKSQRLEEKAHKQEEKILNTDKQQDGNEEE